VFNCWLTITRVCDSFSPPDCSAALIINNRGGAASVN
jgi:hypothetical protein